MERIHGRATITMRAWACETLSTCAVLCPLQPSASSQRANKRRSQTCVHFLGPDGSGNADAHSLLPRCSCLTSPMSHTQPKDDALKMRHPLLATAPSLSGEGLALETRRLRRLLGPLMRGRWAVLMACATKLRFPIFISSLLSTLLALCRNGVPHP